MKKLGVLLPIITLILANCSKSESETTSQPKVSSVSPTSGETGVSASSNIQANFDQDLNSSGIGSGAMTVTYGEKSVTGTVSYVAASRSILFTGALPRGQNITVSISGGVSNTSGKTLGSTYTWTFKTVNPRIYITATAHTGNLGGVSGADSKCTSDGSYTSGKVKAFIVAGASGSFIRNATDTANAGNNQVDWVLYPSTTYVNQAGTTTIGTTNSVGLFTFNLTNAVGGASYWTGFDSADNWTNTNATGLCDSGGAWLSNSGAANGTIGLASAVNSDVIHQNSSACNVAQRLLCIEQ